MIAILSQNTESHLMNNRIECMRDAKNICDIVIDKRELQSNCNVTIARDNIEIVCPRQVLIPLKAPHYHSCDFYHPNFKFMMDEDEKYSMIIFSDSLPYSKTTGDWNKELAVINYLGALIKPFGASLMTSTYYTHDASLDTLVDMINTTKTYGKDGDKYNKCSAELISYSPVDNATHSLLIRRGTVRKKIKFEILTSPSRKDIVSDEVVSATWHANIAMGISKAPVIRAFAIRKAAKITIINTTIKDSSITITYRVTLVPGSYSIVFGLCAGDLAEGIKLKVKLKHRLRVLDATKVVINSAPSAGSSRLLRSGGQLDMMMMMA